MKSPLAASEHSSSRKWGDYRSCWLGTGQTFRLVEAPESTTRMKQALEQSQPEGPLIKVSSLAEEDHPEGSCAPAATA